MKTLKTRILVIIVVLSLLMGACTPNGDWTSESSQDGCDNTVTCLWEAARGEANK